MDSHYRFLTLGIPWTQSMPSRDVNAATRLAEASWRRDKHVIAIRGSLKIIILFFVRSCVIGSIPFKGEVCFFLFVTSQQFPISTYLPCLLCLLKSLWPVALRLRLDDFIFKQRMIMPFIHLALICFHCKQI